MIKGMKKKHDKWICNCLDGLGWIYPAYVVRCPDCGVTQRQAKAVAVTRTCREDRKKEKEKVKCLFKTSARFLQRK